MSDISFNDSALDSLYRREWEERCERDEGQDEDLIEREDEECETMADG